MQASNLPLVGGFANNTSAEALTAALAQSGQAAQQQQTLMQQSYRNLLSNQMAALQPAQNALSQLYGNPGPSQMQGGLGQMGSQNYGAGGSVLPGFTQGLGAMGPPPPAGPPPAAPDPKAYGTFMGIPLSSLHGTQAYADINNIAPGAQAGRNPIGGGTGMFGPMSSIPGTQAYADFHKK